ncbi:hypothetical protein NHX12_025208 [Muraenolepis orangiensis]|uniref:Receptor activity modifying protein 2 n=1 Tax=Muraenolepis orangiensis TaxID=630683 RepID=A0A9Q0IS14_9TELE|nr:hypothetical protein NHX12_025208 [Muraenolepis orangiensis]
MEDAESDQNQQQHPYGHCYQELFEKHSQTLCGLEFQESMEAIGAQNCPYTVLRDCMENLSKLLGCYYPNPSVQDFFLQTHERFFLTCSEDELLLTDAPHNVVVVLTLVPVTLLPLLVYLVVWKSNRRE